MVKTPQHIINMVLDDIAFHEYYRPINVECVKNGANILFEDVDGAVYRLRVDKMENEEATVPPISSLTSKL